ncbi:MAG TPA: XRE family transcriptional regulator [Egibacteraceae bacterium]|nr:XRE family transcriptional regulator [Egibacteraceae bacterium]
MTAPRQAPASSPERGPLATALRAARGDRSMRSVAREAGVSQAHLSRIEAGERGAPPDLIERIAGALQVDAGPLLELTDALPGSVIAALADRDIRLALGPGELPSDTRHLLRRLHIAHIAERVRARLAGPPRGPVDPRRVLAALGWRMEPGMSAAVEFLAGHRVSVPHAADAIRHRFLLAHAVGHLALSDAPACDLQSASDAELDATALAGFLLVPRAELRNFAREEGRRHDLWDPDGSEFLAAAAVRFAVPLWMIARRLGEDGRLAEIAEVDER